jgi:hypothetical protein
MIRSSAIQILENSPARLVVYDPPYEVFGWFFIGAGLFVALIAIIVVLRSSSKAARWFFLGAVPFILFGIAALSMDSFITFSYESGLMSLQKRLFGRSMSQQTFPLDSVVSAIVKSNKDTSQIVLLLKSGEEFRLTSGTDRDGYFAATEAMNVFLSGGKKTMPIDSRISFSPSDAKDVQEALESFFVGTNLDQLKQEWSEPVVDQCRRMVEPISIESAESMSIGRWVAEVEGNRVRLVFPGMNPGVDRRFQFYVVLERQSGLWKAIDHGREEIWRAQ